MRPNIIIHQMGKVGSISIEKAFRKRKIHVVHCHWIGHKDGEFPTIKPDLIKLVQNKQIPPINIITPIREPFSRNLSAFFQNIQKFYPNNEWIEITPQKLKQGFMEKYDHTWPDKWFEKEFPLLFNSPISSFNTEKGYEIYSCDISNLLIIRLEDMDQVFTKAIKEFLNIADMKLEHINASDQKKTNRMLNSKYAELKKMTFPKEFVNKHYELQYAKHFYTKKELDNFKQKWQY